MGSRSRVPLNQLSFQSTTENGLSYELLIDGQPLRNIFNDALNWGIPIFDFGYKSIAWPRYWRRKSGRLRHGQCACPFLPGNLGHPQCKSGVLMISVCSCGEHGCRAVACRVSVRGERVRFSRFRGDIAKPLRSLVFRFTRQNYEDVVQRILQDVARERPQLTYKEWRPSYWEQLEEGSFLDLAPDAEGDC